MCHDDIGDLADQAQVPHPAMELGPCIQCHNPHASAQRKLRKLPDGRECADCHDEQVAGQDEVSHGVISLVGCEACHEPHGGSQEKLLRNAGPELCLSCHGPGVVAVPEDAVTAQLLNRFEISADSARGITILRLYDDLQQDHPIAGHRTLGTPTPEEIGNTESTFSGEFSCLTCHNPHKGKSAKLFNWGAASSMEVCSQCHKK